MSLLKRSICFAIVSMIAAVAAIIGIQAPANAANWCSSSIAMAAVNGVGSGYYSYASFTFQGGVASVYYQQQYDLTALLHWNTSSWQTSTNVNAVVFNVTGQTGRFPPGWVVMLYLC